MRRMVSRPRPNTRMRTASEIARDDRSMTTKIDSLGCALADLSAKSSGTKAQLEEARVTLSIKELSALQESELYKEMAAFADPRCG